MFDDKAVTPSTIFSSISLVLYYLKIFWCNEMLCIWLHQENCIEWMRTKPCYLIMWILIWLKRFLIFNAALSKLVFSFTTFNNNAKLSKCRFIDNIHFETVYWQYRNNHFSDTNSFIWATIFDQHWRWKVWKILNFKYIKILIEFYYDRISCNLEHLKNLKKFTSSNSF